MRSTKFTALLLLLLLSLSCEVKVPTEVYDNPLDIEEAEEKGIETPALVFFPDSVSVAVGTSVSIQVFVLEVDSLAASRIQVIYDRNKLSLSSVSVGDFFRGTADPIFIFEDNAAAGTLDIYTSFLGTDSAFVSGTENLTYLVFNTTAPGQSTLEYTSQCELVDQDDRSIDIRRFGQGIINAQ